MNCVAREASRLACAEWCDAVLAGYARRSQSHLNCVGLAETPDLYFREGMIAGCLIFPAW